MHKTKACIITCIDFRFHKKVNKFLQEKGYMGQSDEIIIAGACRDFVKPVNPGDGLYVWKQLGLSVKLHEPDDIVFIDHQDCGGYAQDGTIPPGLTKEEDSKSHSMYLAELKKIAKEKYPDKNILFFYAPLDGEVEQLAI